MKLSRTFTSTAGALLLLMSVVSAQQPTPAPPPAPPSDSTMTIAGRGQPRGAKPGATAPGTLDPAVINPILDKLAADVAAMKDALNNPPCTVTFDKPSLYYGAPSGRVPLQLKALQGCTWKVTAPDWITVTPANGTGDKALTVEAKANTTPAARKATVTVGTGSFVVTQEGTPIVPPPPPPPPPVTGDVTVPAGGDIQKAIDTTPGGKTIWLAAGAQYKVNLMLRKRADTGVVTIRTIGTDDKALPPGVRVTPEDAARLKFAQLSPADPLFATVSNDNGASSYTFIGVEWTGNTVHPDRDLIQHGVDQVKMDWVSSYDDLPANITYDRVYIHADPAFGGHRGIMADGKNFVITNSDIRGFWDRGRDSQAVGCMQAQGLRVENNYLEGSGENFMCGGTDPRIPGATPTNVVFRFNTVSKPLSWRPVYRSTTGAISNTWSDGAVLVSGYPGSVKNIFEFKNVIGATVEYNVFENVWVDAQAGSAILFTVRNQEGGCNWCTIKDVTFRYNVIRNVQNFAFNVLAIDNHFPTVPAANIVISNNLILDTSSGAMVGEAINGFDFGHNTITGIKYSLLSLTRSSVSTGFMQGLNIHDNVTPGGIYGVFGDNTGSGTIALDTFAKGGYRMTANVIEGNTERTITYPAGNTTLAPGTLLGKLDAQYRYTGTEAPSDDGKLGANIDELLAKIKGLTLAK
jgi:hypothetical protein